MKLKYTQTDFNQETTIVRKANLLFKDQEKIIFDFLNEPRSRIKLEINVKNNSVKITRTGDLQYELIHQEKLITKSKFYYLGANSLTIDIKTQKVKITNLEDELKVEIDYIVDKELKKSLYILKG